MWEAGLEIIDNNTHKFSLLENEVPLSYERVIRYWQDDFEFRGFYFSILRESSFDAFFWENPPLTKSSLDQNYEFVLVNSPQLSKVTADPASFQEQFNAESLSNDILSFENLGRDAQLIVPRAVGPQDIYPHLSTFIRNGPENQKHDLFITLGNSLAKRVNNHPTWVSTSGLGVYWLHIRLDTRPKYYSYQAYRSSSV
jgi:hypothetical protein